MLAESGEEGGCIEGLGLLPMKVKQFDMHNKQEKMPHMGWNSIFPKKKSVLLDNVPNESDFYFAHSYHVVLDNEKISFSTRFGGAPCDIFLPIQSIVGIYAQENGQGMIFQGEDPKDPEPSGPTSVTSVPPSKKLPRGSGTSDVNKKPSLRIVK